MMSWRRRSGLIALVSVYLLAAILWAFLPDNRSLPSATLADGRSLRVRSITVGTNHVYRSEPGWKSQLRGFLRGRMGAWLGPKPPGNLTRTTREPSLVIWMQTSPIAGVKPGRYRPRFSDIKVVADHGEVFDGHDWPAREVLPDSVMLPLIIPVYPRRDHDFSVTGVLDGSDFNLRIPNPEPFPNQVSAPPGGIPATNVAGDVQVILRSGTYTTFEWGQGPELDFEFREHGTNASDRFGRWWTVSDITGNEGWRIPTNEPVWMIDLRYHRSKSIAWRRHRYHNFTITNALTPMTYWERDSNVQVMSTQIRKVWLGGAGTFTWIDGEITSVTAPPADGKNQPYHGSTAPGGGRQLKWGRAEPWVMVDSSEIDQSKHVLSVFLIDSRGRKPTVSRHANIIWGRMNATMFRLPPDQNPELSLVPPITVQVVIQDLGKTRFVIDPAKLPRVDKASASK